MNEQLIDKLQRDGYSVALKNMAGLYEITEEKTNTATQCRTASGKKVGAMAA